MGTVVTLPPRRAPQAVVRRTDDATILLFMGVRYVRERDAGGTPDPEPMVVTPVTDVILPPLEIA